MSSHIFKIRITLDVVKKRGLVVVVVVVVVVQC